MNSDLKNFILNQPDVDDESVVFTVRLRLARNFRKYPFPHQMGEKQAEQLVEHVIDAIKNFSQDTPLILHMKDTDKIIRQVLVERHIISPEFAEDSFGKTLIWLVQSGLKILVNEEDHLRISAFGKKNEIEKLWQILNDFDDNLSQHINYAFDREFGYLTSCPTNVGPGLRVSSLVFLPSLKLTGRIKVIFNTVCKLGCIIRGFYGEGSASIANFYQISTGPALGKKETEICSEFDAVLSATEKQELSAMERVRTSSIKELIKKFFDRIYDSNEGISSDDAIKGISILIFGKNLGIIKVDRCTLKKMIYRILPGSIQFEMGRLLQEKERDILRLQILRKELVGLYV